MKFEQPPQTNNEEEKMEQPKNHLMKIIQDAKAFTTEELESLEEFISEPSTMETFSSENLEKIIETDEKFGATSRILIAARAWLDNKK